MTAKENKAVKPLVIERTFDAPIARVWKAITNNEDMKQWYFVLKEFKPKVGFKFQFTGEDKGFIYVHHCTIKEVIPGKKLVYSWRYEGYEGDSQVTFELFAKGKQTRLKLTHSGLETFPKIPAFAPKNFVAGWTHIIGLSLKKFVENDTSDREILIARVINAPRQRVWKAVADTKHVEQWWGPNGFTTTTKKREFKVGGVWQHTMHGPDGTDYPNKSIFVEIVKPERIVYKHSGGAKGAPGANFVSTWTFEAMGKNKTKVIMRSVFPSAKDRDTVVKFYGAIEGGKQTLARLERFIKS